VKCIEHYLDVLVAAHHTHPLLLVGVQVARLELQAVQQHTGELNKALGGWGSTGGLVSSASVQYSYAVHSSVHMAV
jgi:hypothetical protein